MRDYVLNGIKQLFPVSETDAGEFSEISKGGMHFHIKTYQAEGAGKLFLMDMKAMGGLMRMGTLTFTPTSLDGPIISIDEVYALGRSTLVLELYDTTLSHPGFHSLDPVKEEYSPLPSYVPEDHPYYRFRMPQSDYKRGRGIKTQLSTMAEQYFKAYLNELRMCSQIDPSEKIRKNQEFSNSLFESGGPAVNKFKEMIGEDKTKIFLTEYMY